VRSKNGKAIIAMSSTAKNGTISRISAFLPTGGAVTTSRADVHYVVTEYGIAQLGGRTLRERMRSLVDIAHPNFRDEIEKDCQLYTWLR
jgi:acyl-CoA hydrolase